MGWTILSTDLFQSKFVVAWSRPCNQFTSKKMGWTKQQQIYQAYAITAAATAAKPHHCPVYFFLT
jgi:hypothetical protein